jgi:hypothetical protein
LDLEAPEARVLLSAAPSDVLTYHSNNLRLGLDSAETALTPQSVNPTGFGRPATYNVDGFVCGYCQSHPLDPHQVECFTLIPRQLADRPEHAAAVHGEPGAAAGRRRHQRLAQLHGGVFI